MNKLKMHSVNKVNKNIEKIYEMFPSCITERKNKSGEVEYAVDFDMLKQELSSVIVEGREERYQFTWPDKKKSILLANTEIDKTLRPCREESVEFDNTENLYIEGDNLEVLKLLQETYLGKVKMIYIDPPYNTGNDFVYEDDFSIDYEEYKENSGQFDDEGNRLVKNLESNGRFHTDWLNMMYPRLKLARDLLTDDGVIFISIDDNEVENLKRMCSEILGRTNCIGEIVWQTATDNNPSQISVEHEYILCFAKNKLLQPKWFINSEKARSINEQYKYLKNKYGMNIEVIEKELKKWIKRNEKNLKGVAHYSYVDKKGVYYPGNSSNTKPGGYVFDIIHPVTRKVCKKPEYGYRWTEKTFWEAERRGDVEWGNDENVIPKIKKRIDSVTEQLKSYYYEDSRYWTKYLNNLFGKRVFENPKSTNLIYRFLKFVSQSSDIVLDFFSGSATTAHAVMKLNAEDGEHRKFIMVQIPEMKDENSEAFKAGYKNVCEIGKERIRRAGVKIKEEYGESVADLDIGFRVLKCDSTNMKDVYYKPSDFQESYLESLANNIKEDRSPEDLLFQVMLDLGVLLSSKIKEKVIGGKKVFSVNDGYLIACFDDDINERTVEAIAKMKPYYAVFRDSGYSSDSVATNFEQIFNSYSPNTERRVL